MNAILCFIIVIGLSLSNPGFAASTETTEESIVLPPLEVVSPQERANFFAGLQETFSKYFESLMSASQEKTEEKSENIEESTTDVSEKINSGIESIDTQVEDAKGTINSLKDSADALKGAANSKSTELAKEIAKARMSQKMGDVKSEASRLKEKMGDDVNNFKDEVKNSMTKW